MSAVAPTTRSPDAGRTAWVRNLGAPVREYLRAETGGAIVLVIAAVVALLWANVAPHAYESVWTTRLSLRLGDHGLSATLRTWVDQGLMTLFFLVVGLEAKREMDLGELRERTRIAIPVLCALGGMAAAVALYLAINAGGAGAHGWGAAMSTDTALALGALAVVGPEGSTRLRVFLLTMVVIDDLVALVVIAVAYTGHISIVALVVAIGLFGVLAALRFLDGEWRNVTAVIVGLGIWLALFKSGIDPVIAGLAIGLVTSAYPPARDDLERATELTRSFREQPTPELAYNAQRSLTSAISPNERILFRLHPWVSFVVVPLFALANAGIHLDSDLLGRAVGSPVTIGIVVAYVVGKPLGILLAAWAGTRRDHASRLTITWPGLVGTGAVAGVAFTVSLLIAGLALHGDRLGEAKVGILAAAILAPTLGAAVFWAIDRLPEAMRARQLGAMPGALIDLADDVDPARDHIRGPQDATVTLVEYADFECPFCGQTESIVRELLARRDDDVRYVFRHLPLNDVHPHAQVAAEAAEAAAAQGKFWEMHDMIFSRQGELNLRTLREVGEGLGLDMDRVADELRDRHWAPRIAVDVASADASGVSGTPTFFINGRRHQGVYDIDALSRAIKQARALAQASAAFGAGT